MMRFPVPVIGFAAFSGVGKTTLLKRLIPLLKDRGLRVGLIKKTHHDVEIDRPGKDSHELRQAGARAVMLSSPKRRMLITEHPEPREPELLDDIAGFSAAGVDVILVEGYRDQPIPKIELHRPSLGHARLYPGDPAVIAVATDDPQLREAVIPVLDLNRPEGIADFLITYLARHEHA